MCQGIGKSLKSGGRFVTVNCTPALDFTLSPSYRKYGFEASVMGKWQEGVPIKFTFYLEEGSFAIEDYYWDVATYEEALFSAGFREVRWHRPRLSPEGEAAFEKDYWTTFLNHPPLTLIECLR